jgi:hypothetical protein
MQCGHVEVDREANRARKPRHDKLAPRADQDKFMRACILEDVAAKDERVDQWQGLTRHGLHLVDVMGHRSQSPRSAPGGASTPTREWFLSIPNQSSNVDRASRSNTIWGWTNSGTSDADRRVTLITTTYGGTAGPQVSFNGRAGPAWRPSFRVKGPSGRIADYADRLKSRAARVMWCSRRFW